MEGRVEILHDGQWGTVCGDHWDKLGATVVCAQLGFVGNSYAVSAAQFGPGDSSMPIWLDNIFCEGTEDYLSECRHSGWGVHNCHHYEDAGVICQESEFTVPVRLVNGTVSYEGRVEIYLDSHWGTICDIFWSMADASVVCRQLGYPGASDVLFGSYFGAGNLPIVIAYTNCYGYEPQLANCSGFSGSDPPYIPSWYCTANTVAGVRCIGEYLTTFKPILKPHPDLTVSKSHLHIVLSPVYEQFASFVIYIHTAMKVTEP